MIGSGWSRRQSLTFGGLDILINNAGIGSWGHFATSTEEIVRRVIEVNFFGPVELTRLALPHSHTRCRAVCGSGDVDVRSEGDARLAGVLCQ
jgi:NAD(P)-dependent dehydrogenase (short-subunit alcohol dehydrogenase family)